MKWFRTYNNAGGVAVADIPVLEYGEFYNEVCLKLKDASFHIGMYFAVPLDDELVFFCLLLDDSSGEILINSHIYGYYSEDPLESLTAVTAQMHPFEREISELHGVKFRNNPWDKPLRFPYNRARQASVMDNYPFYNIEGESLHQVNVGPIHAGIIEPGAFRFICNGEKVLHLEIALGYQHRGVESLMISDKNRLRQAMLCESIAGDSAIAHTTVYANLMEKLSVENISNRRTSYERCVAIELERIAMHLADTGALCMDIGYQLGQVACEALRTIVINSMQLWCGNRFGKGLVRTGGSHFHINRELSEIIIKNIREVRSRYFDVREDLKKTPSLLARFEDCGIVTTNQLQKIGAVGLAARAGGLYRDIRSTHPWGIWDGGLKPLVETKSQGDIMARLLLRGKELFRSADLLPEMLKLAADVEQPSSTPVYDLNIRPSTLSFSFVEGWRGEIAHAAVTDKYGEIATYKIKDPSVHNWMALALSVRGEGISDFPLCNKSFNLSYCGHDL